MASIRLFTTSSDTNLILEDISDQIDGSKLAFTTTFSYEPGTLFVIYNGITYTKNNDFTETGPKEFTFVNEDPFPPEVDCPLVVRYIKITL